MRTTLKLDDDIHAAVKERARREGRSVGEVLSELARQGLTRHGQEAEGEGEAFCGFEPFPNRGRAVSNALIDRLLEEEAE